MDIAELEKYSINIDAFQPMEIKDFEFMSDEELYNYQTELEHDTGNLSDWDHIRAFFTMKKKLLDLKECDRE